MLQLLPMEESDLYAYQTVFAGAFRNDLMAMMYPNGYSEEAKRFGIDLALKEWRSDPECVKMMKVIDTDISGDQPTGRIVGVAKWKFHPEDRTPEELEKDEKAYLDRPLAPGANAAFFKEFFGAVAQCMKEIVGTKAFATLSVLATLPDHHRRGIGAMHMKWGLEQADNLGLQTYIEASPMGRPLYERFGFEEVMPLPLDAKRWGLSHDLPHVCMIRPAQMANGKAL